MCELNVIFSHISGCQFYPVGEYLKFVRVPENLETGTEILSLEGHPRDRLSIMPVDKVHSDFFYINSSIISIIAIMEYTWSNPELSNSVV